MCDSFLFILVEKCLWAFCSALVNQIENNQSYVTARTTSHPLIRWRRIAMACSILYILYALLVIYTRMKFNTVSHRTYTIRYSFFDFTMEWNDMEHDQNIVKPGACILNEEIWRKLKTTSGILYTGAIRYFVISIVLHFNWPNIKSMCFDKFCHSSHLLRLHLRLYHNLNLNMHWNEGPLRKHN